MSDAEECFACSRSANDVSVETSGIACTHSEQGC